MPAIQNAITVDVDGHVLEPRDTWQKYLEPKLRERAIRIEKDDQGVEVLLVEDMPHLALRGRLGALGQRRKENRKENLCVFSASLPRRAGCCREISVLSSVIVATLCSQLE